MPGRKPQEQLVPYTTLNMLFEKMGEVHAIARGLDMLPAAALTNVVGMGWADAKQLAESYTAERRSTDSENSGSRQFGVRSSFAGLAADTPLPSGISHVGGLLTPKQMGGIAARRVVAFVQRPMLGRWARLAVQYQRDVGRQHHLAVNLNVPIAAGNAASGPRPTIVGTAALNLRPKTIFRRRRYFFYSKGSHCEASFRGGQGRALFPQRFRPALFARKSGVSQQFVGAA
jgi:hypothetical protein